MKRRLAGPKPTRRKKRRRWVQNQPEEEEKNKKKKKEVRFKIFFFKAKIWYRPKYVFWPKLTGMLGMPRNRLKLDPRWNERYYGTGFHAGTKFSSRFSRNGIESIPMVSIISRRGFGGSCKDGKANFCHKQGGKCSSKQLYKLFRPLQWGALNCLWVYVMK